MVNNTFKYNSEKRILLIVALLLVLIVILRLISMYDVVDDGLNYLSSVLRTVIYIGIIITWAISVRNRVLNPSVRRYMLAVAALLLFWFIVRSIKFHFLAGVVSLQYYCWYSYYIPMIFIPLIGIFMAASLGRPADYTLPPALKLLMIPATLLVVTILTNNFHEMIFAFPYGRSEGDPPYVYRPMYFLCLFWMIGESVALLTLLLIRSKVPQKGKRIWGPVIPVAAGILYAVGYVARVPVLFTVAGDITAFLTLVILAVCEACIQSRLVPSNTRYIELLHASTIGAQIVDEAYNRCIVADNAEKFSEDVMRMTEKGTVEIGNKRLSGAPVTGGHVIWMEDISEIRDVMKRLEDTGAMLAENNNLLRNEVELKEKQARADEEKRVYDKIAEEVKPQLQKLESLLELSDEDDNVRANLGMICVISSYIKRYGNLILIGEESGFIKSQELEYCLRESVENIRLCGATISLACRCEGILAKDSVLASYVFFEDVIEKLISTMDTMLINLSVVSGNVEMVFSISGRMCSFEPDGEFLAEHNAKASVSVEEDDMRISFLIREGGTDR